MKKIIKSSVMLFGICFFAGKVNAQLSSEKAALTAEQAAAIMKPKNPAAQTSTTAGAAVASQAPAGSFVQSKKVIAAIPVSDQGGVKPVLTAEAPAIKTTSATPVATAPAEVKASSTPANDQKTKQ